MSNAGVAANSSQDHLPYSTVITERFTGSNFTARSLVSQIRPVKRDVVNETKVVCRIIVKATQILKCSKKAPTNWHGQGNCQSLL
jgi:hypothetical protein